jgi:hypothetical protein
VRQANKSVSILFNKNIRIIRPPYTGLVNWRKKNPFAPSIPRGRRRGDNCSPSCPGPSSPPLPSADVGAGRRAKPARCRRWRSSLTRARALFGQRRCPWWSRFRWRWRTVGGAAPGGLVAAVRSVGGGGHGGQRRRPPGPDLGPSGPSGLGRARSGLLCLLLKVVGVARAEGD